MTKEAYIRIPQEEIDYINNLLKMTGEEIYDRYGLKRDETISYTADFGDGFEADIVLVVCGEHETPYVDTILFYDGGEVCCDVLENDRIVPDTCDAIQFEADGDVFKVYVVVAQ